MDNLQLKAEQYRRNSHDGGIQNLLPLEDCLVKLDLHGDREQNPVNISHDEHNLDKHQ